MFSFQVYQRNTLNTYHWRPKPVDAVDVWRGWYTIDGIESDVIQRLTIQNRSTAVKEDVSLVESVQRGLNSRGCNPGPLVLDPKSGVNSEHSIKVIYGWVRDTLPDA